MRRGGQRGEGRVRRTPVPGPAGIAIPHVGGAPADRLRDERVIERVLVHDLGAGHVDEYRGGLHEPELARPEQALGVRGEGQRDNHVVGLLQHVVQAFHPPEKGDLAGVSVGRSATDGPDLHVEGAGQPGHAPTDAAVAEDASVLPESSGHAGGGSASMAHGLVHAPRRRLASSRPNPQVEASIAPITNSAMPVSWPWALASCVPPGRAARSIRFRPEPGTCTSLRRRATAPIAGVKASVTSTSTSASCGTTSVSSARTTSQGTSSRARTRSASLTAKVPAKATCT